MPLLIKRALPLLIAIALLAYALKDISFATIGNQFRQANYWLIALLSLLTVGSYFLRGKRWQQPLKALGYQATAFRATIAIQTGVISSMIILGSGELTRCATLQRTDRVPISQGIGSVVAERVIDLFMLLLVLLLTFVLELNRMYQYFAGLSLAIPPSWLMLGLISLICLGVLVGIGLLKCTTIRQHPLVAKVVGLLQGFGQGFMAIRQLPNLGLFILLTVINQVLAWLGTYLLLLAVDYTHNLPPTAALTIMAVSSLGGLAVPTQGGIGTYHFLVSRALALYGFTAVEGAVIATFMHAVGFAVNLLLSGLSFLIVPILITQKQAKTTADV